MADTSKSPECCPQIALFKIRTNSQIQYKELKLSCFRLLGSAEKDGCLLTVFRHLKFELSSERASLHSLLERQTKLRF